MKDNIKKTSGALALIYTIVYAFVSGIQIFIVLPVLRSIPHKLPFDINMFISVVPLYLFGFPLAVYLASLIPSSDVKKEKVKLSLFGFLKIFAAAYFMFYTGGLLSNMLSSLIRAYTGLGAVDPASLMIKESGLFSIIISAVVIAPIGEEILFRLIPYRKLSQYGDKTYILLSALFFALFHMNFFQFIYAFLVGLVFAYVYARTRLLRYPVILHMAMNTIGSVLAPIASVNAAFANVFAFVVIAFVFIGMYQVIRAIHDRKVVLDPATAKLSVTHTHDAFINIGTAVFILLFFGFSIYNL